VNVQSNKLVVISMMMSFSSFIIFLIKIQNSQFLLIFTSFYLLKVVSESHFLALFTPLPPKKEKKVSLENRMSS